MVTDHRTGMVFDYRRKKGVIYSEILLPDNSPGWARDRASLWNAAEAAETRKNSTVAREFEIALPSELEPEQRKKLAVDFARELVIRHGCAADVAIHAPGKGGDQRNHHAHILLTTRRLTPMGFSEKTRELDDKKAGEVARWRERYAAIQNQLLGALAGAELVDHRSHKDRGIATFPGRHLGPSAVAFERRAGKLSRKRLDYETEVRDRLMYAKMLGTWERVEQELTASLLDLSGDLTAALDARRALSERNMSKPQVSPSPSIVPTLGQKVGGESGGSEEDCEEDDDLQERPYF